nr:MAG TPA: Signal transducer and activator of transcription 2 C terminal [Caudoviricetes sp.]
MTIETKYNIGDLVSYRPEHPLLSSATTSTINTIYAHFFRPNNLLIEYVMTNGDIVNESRILPK